MLTQAHTPDTPNLAVMGWVVGKNQPAHRLRFRGARQTPPRRRAPSLKSRSVTADGTSAPSHTKCNAARNATLRRAARSTSARTTSPLPECDTKCSKGPAPTRANSASSPPAASVRAINASTTPGTASSHAVSMKVEASLTPSPSCLSSNQSSAHRETDAHVTSVPPISSTSRHEPSGRKLASDPFTSATLENHPSGRRRVRPRGAINPGVPGERFHPGGRPDRGGNRDDAAWAAGPAGRCRAAPWPGPLTDAALRPSFSTSQWGCRTKPEG